MNLIEGLLKEIGRNRELLVLYEDIPQGAFGATMIKQGIEFATQSMTEGNTVNMLLAYQQLKESQ